MILKARVGVMATDGRADEVVREGTEVIDSVKGGGGARRLMVANRIGGLYNTFCQDRG